MQQLMRKCSECGKPFPLEEYHKSKTHKMGHHKKCPECRSKEASKYYQENKRKVRKKQDEYYWKNREKILADKKRKYWEKKEREEEEQAKDFTEFDDLPDLW